MKKNIKKRRKDIDSKSSFSNMQMRRTVNIFLCCVFIAAVFILKILYLDTFGGDKYRKAAMAQRRKTVEIPADRGEIFDRNMKPMAKSVKINTIYAFPKQIKDKEQTAKDLSNILEINSKDILSKIDNDEIENVKIVSNINKEQLDLIKESELKGISISNEIGRYYLSSVDNNTGSSVLGFVNSENNGSQGVEKQYNKELKGNPGVNIFSKSGEGKIIPYEDNVVYEPTKGSNLQLTIDEAIQGATNRAGQRTMEEYSLKNLSIIVSSPKTGEIYALENFPNFDSNSPRKPRNDIEKQEMEELSGDELLEKYYDIWRSYSISDAYEPGSVFKGITTAAAIEEGTATKDSTYFCDGYIRDIPGIVIRCHSYANPHGEQTLQEAMNNSCNPAFVQIARDLGKEKLYKYLKDFGFGEVTNIDLPGEEKGIIPASLEDIGEANLATMSYGHGIAATPIQMVTAMNAVVNGGDIIEPHIVKNILNKNNEIEESNEGKKSRQVISKKTSETLRDMLQHVVKDGGANAVSIPGYKIGAKSGTSIKLENGKYTSKKTVASFYTMFPADDPEYSILVVADEPEGPNTGNAVAGTTAKMIIDDIIKQKQLEPSEDIDNELEMNNIEVPNLVGLTIKDAVNRLLDLGLKTDIVNTNMNDMSIVEYQYPDATQKVRKGTAVSLTSNDLGSVMVQMPKLEERTISYVENMLNKVNIKYEIEGPTSGKVIKTEPKAGELVDPEATVKIVLFDPDYDNKNSSDKKSEYQEDIMNDEDDNEKIE